MSENATGNVRVVLQAVDNASSTMQKVKVGMTQLSGALSQLGGGFASVNNIMQGFAAGGPWGAAAAAIGEIIGQAEKAVRVFAQFETAMVDVAAASGASGEELIQLRKDLQEAAMAAGVEFGVGATEAMKAMESLVKAGLEGEEAITALSAALTMAQVEGMATAEAADLMVGIMGMFQMSAEEAAHAVDVMVNASIAGIATSNEFATALSYVGGRANQLGFSLEETTAALVAMNNQGIAATTAGQSLNMMMTQMIQKSDTLGFSLYDSQGNMLSLAEISGNLVDKLNSFSTEAERNAYLTSVFGARAGRAAAALAGFGDTGAEVQAALEALTEEMEEGGTSADILEQKQDTLAATGDRLAAMFENLYIMIGEILAPVLEWFANFIEQYIIPFIEDIIPPIAAVVNAFLTFIDTIWKLGQIIAHYLKPIIDGIMAFLGPLIEAIKAVVEAVMFLFGILVEAVNTAYDEITQTNDAIVDDMEDTADEINEISEEEQAEYDRLAAMYQEYADSRMGVNDQIVEDTEETVDAVTDAFNNMDQTVVGSMEQMAANATAAIQQGLVGDAQDAIHDFVECSTTKQQEMVEDIDGYLEDMREQYRENMIEIRRLQDAGMHREAELLMKHNNELTRKMDQLLIWRDMILQQQWDSTTDAVRQALMDQYGLYEQYYSDLTGLDEEFFPDPVEPIIDPIRELPFDEIDPIRFPQPDPITIAPTVGNVQLDFHEPVDMIDARRIAEDVYSELQKIQEEQQRQRGYQRNV
jgi:TP901 family phage tail tape measure protein